MEKSLNDMENKIDIAEKDLIEAWEIIEQNSKYLSATLHNIFDLEDRKPNKSEKDKLNDLGLKICEVQINYAI